MHLAIFGGTFNPVHYGHLKLAEETRESFKLDKVVFMPCCLPPHKGDKAVAPPDARVAMLKLAIKENDFFIKCTRSCG